MSLVIHRDRFRTMINVWGDSVGAGIVAKLSKAKLQQADTELNDTLAISHHSSATHADSCSPDAKALNGGCSDVIATSGGSAGWRETAAVAVANGGFVENEDTYVKL